MIRSRVCVAVLVLALAGMFPVVASGAAATESSESEGWLEVGVRLKPFKGWRLTFSQHLRWDEDWTRLRRIMPEVALSYRPWKPLRFLAAYRWVGTRTRDGDVDAGHRLHFDAVVAQKLSRLRFQYRLRFEVNWETTHGDSVYEHVMRHRIKAGVLKLKPVTPYAAGELHVEMSGDEALEAMKWRATVGASYQLKRHELDLHYHFERPIGDFRGPDRHILGIGYRFDL